jgi:adenosylmethionine-8-amino-7-oxononanoate aminotransferase
LVEARHHELAAFVLEPVVQGAAGMLLADPADVALVAAACREADVLLVADEVATGFGRTGRLFASELCGIQPDLMAVGKGIAAGYLAMSATVAAAPVFEAFLGEDLGPRTFYHGHSFGGNALAAAVALRHLELLDEWEVLANVRARAAQLAQRLAESITPLSAVRTVRQQGLMVGVELAPPAPGLRWGRRVCAGAVDRGVLLRPLGDVVVIMPPLTTTAPEIDRIVDTLGAAIVEGTDA